MHKIEFHDHITYDIPFPELTLFDIEQWGLEAVPLYKTMTLLINYDKRFLSQYKSLLIWANLNFIWATAQLKVKWLTFSNWKLKLGPKRLFQWKVVSGGL